MATETAPAEFVRQDGKEKVTGTGRYTADLGFTSLAHAKFRYADHSHAKILKIDTSKAKALPGVVTVVTQDDLPDVRYGGFVQDRYLFAKDVVRFEGEIVAGVVGLTEEIAAEGARLIEIEYEPLPVVTDFVAAMEPDAPVIHPDLGTYGKDENIVADGNTMAYHTIVKGDADAAMADADVVVKSHYVSDASQGVPIEPRAVVAQWQGDKVTIWSSTQVPYAARAGVAQTLEIPEADVRVIVPLLGGGFGAKCDLHFEGQVAALARAAHRPVRLVLSREEEFKIIAQRREGISMDFETAATRDGHLVARRAKLVLDKGAYCGEGGFLGQMAAMHACGPYRIDRISVEAFLNYTNNQPSGSVRAPTAPQVCWGLEQHMDEVAAAQEVRDQLLGAAAEQLEADRDDLELAEGVARVKGSPERSIAIADLVGEIGTVHGKGSGVVPDVPTGDTGGCVGRLGNETFLAPQLITQAAHVKVDRSTGVVRVLKVAAAHDSGRILNRMGADGQVLGGVVMGLGLALSEGTMLDEQGRQRNPHLLDYKLLTSSDVPEIEIAWVEYDSVGPRGTKGVGEPPQVPTAGAVANAISKVIGGHVRRLPMTPERVWEAARGMQA